MTTRKTSPLLLLHRPLQEAEARVLHEELRTTPNIIGYTARELLRFGDVLVAQGEDGAFAGACISKDLLLGWTDLAALYVLPAFRGRGVGARLYQAAWDRAWGRGRHLFTLSRSPAVIHLMTAGGMTLTRAVWRVPLAAHLEMNRHMCSWYRNREMWRKRHLIQEAGPLVAGTKRNEAPARRKR